MSRGRVEGIDGGEDPDEAPGVKAWNRYLRHQDELAAADDAAVGEAGAVKAAEDEQARQRVEALARAASEAAARPKAPGPLASAAGAAAAAAAANLRNILTQTPEQRRMDVMAAMQAEALARLEVAPHADHAVIGQRDALKADAAAELQGRELSEGRRLDREARDPETPGARRPDALHPAQDKVGRAKSADRKRPKPRDG